MSNLDQLMKLNQYGMKRDSLLALNTEVSDSTVVKPDSSALVTDSTVVEKDDMLLTPFSELPTIPGLREGGPLDLLAKGTIVASESDAIVAQQQAEIGKIAARKIQSGIKTAGESIEKHGVDYRNAVLANTLGAPVDVANTLLSLLGIEMSDRPFMGSRNIKQALDALSGIPHSERFIMKEVPTKLF